MGNANFYINPIHTNIMSDLEKKEEIQKIYDHLIRKKLFITRLAALVNLSPASIQNNWFHGFKTIPKHRLDLVLKEIKNEPNDN